jgi:uncharacterized Zn finger protein
MASPSSSSIQEASYIAINCTCGMDTQEVVIDDEENATLKCECGRVYDITVYMPPFPESPHAV